MLFYTFVLFRKWRCKKKCRRFKLREMDSRMHKVIFHFLFSVSVGFSLFSTKEVHEVITFEPVVHQLTLLLRCAFEFQLVYLFGKCV